MSATPQRAIRRGAIGVGGLAVVVAGLGAYAWVRPRAPAATDGPVLVTVTSRGCEPATLRVPAGRVTFQITNRSERALEWEILDGVMVVDERENIAPGLSQRLSTRLEPGDYSVTCGLLSNPRGRLTVAPSAAPNVPQRPELIALVAPMAEYKVFVTVGAADLAYMTDTLADAVHQGDRDAALAALDAAHAAYGRIRPATKMLFADLDAAIDGAAAARAGGDADPEFTGFQRLAVGLRRGQDTAGLGTVADRLNADVHALAERVAAVSIAPGRMVAGASLLLGEAASAGRAREPAVLAANIDGAEKVAELLKPLTRKVDPAVSDRLDATFAAARHALAASPHPDYSAIETLAAQLASLRGTLGLDG